MNQGKIHKEKQKAKWKQSSCQKLCKSEDNGKIS